MQQGMNLVGRIINIAKRETRGGTSTALMVEIDQGNSLAGPVVLWLDESERVPPVGTVVFVPGILEIRNERLESGKYRRSQWWHPEGVPVPVKGDGS